MERTYRPRLTRWDLAHILTDMDNRDFNYSGKIAVRRAELKAKLEKHFQSIKREDGN